MKNQALFSSKDKSKKLKCRPLQFLFGALRVKDKSFTHFDMNIFYSLFVLQMCIKHDYQPSLQTG